MAKKPSPNPKGSLPTKEEILDFIATQSGKVGKREIARAFNVSGGARIGLKTLLKDMTEQGLLAKRGRHVHQPGELPPVTVLDIVSLDQDGELMASPAEWDEDLYGSTPKARVIISKKKRSGPAPGIGDRILARIDRDPDDGAYVARIMKTLTKRTNRILGVLRENARGEVRLQPIDKKARTAFDVKPSDLNGARLGDLVAAEPLGDRGYGLPKVRVKEKLASIDSEKAISLIAIHNHDIPHEFPKDCLKEAKAAQEAVFDEREDLTSLPFVTIDPPDAKDHDDAVCAYLDEDPANDGGWIVWVAIADVAHFVRPGSALDREALRRGNSVYFPDRVVPMLPERISNDLCSLREKENRAALAVRMVFDRSGRKKGQRFTRAIIRSHAKLSYLDAQKAFDGDPINLDPTFVKTVLMPVHEAYQALARARDDREPLDLDLPERKLVLNDDGAVERVVTPQRLTAHRLIEELMIQANVAAAEALEAKRFPLIYRVHDAPSLEKLTALRQFLETLDLSLSKAENLRPSHFNRILGKAEGETYAHLVNEVVLRSQSQAEYTPENYGHFGLNLRRYAHFTSPIRRYADLVVHRALVGAYELGDDGYSHNATPPLGEIAATISAAERRAMAAERETVDRLIAAFLADQVGVVFEARINGVNKAGIFIRLSDTGADGFIPLSSLDYDFFHVDEAMRAIIGERTGTAFQIGDTVEVKLREVSAVAGALRFEMLSDGKTLPASALHNTPRNKRSFRRKAGPAIPQGSKSRPRKESRTRRSKSRAAT